MPETPSIAIEEIHQALNCPKLALIFLIYYIMEFSYGGIF